MATSGRHAADEAILAALAAGATVEAAAAQAGVSPATVYRRLREPAFQQRLAEMRAGVVRRTAEALGAAALGAVATLVALQKDGLPPGVRLGAARAVLDLALRTHEMDQLERRLAELEEKIKGTR